MRRLDTLSLFLFTAATLFLATSYCGPSLPARLPTVNSYYLGFDRNAYPGDAAMQVLRKTFSFTSYWIGPPPSEKQSTWLGKRELLARQGFGFEVLFSGREARESKNAADAQQKGRVDAAQAIKSAQSEGFAQGTVIFLDIEEGGRLPDNYHEYLRVWFEALLQAGYRPGVYCSAIPVNEGKGVSITTAQDIKNHAAAREIVYWVYNDVCPPSPGCTFPSTTMSPARSGFADASIWQFAQSPRRKEFTAQCAATYAADGNCYAPGDAAHKWFLDVNVANTANPSSASR